MSNHSYPYWDAYQLKVVNNAGGIIMFEGPLESERGTLLTTLLHHLPMTYEGRELSFDQEIDLIRQIHAGELGHVRYPMVEECGQICIYPSHSFFYATILGNAVIDTFDSLDDTYDEAEETPALVLPTKDVIGLLEDCIYYHKFDREDWTYCFSGIFLHTNAKHIFKTLSEIYEGKGELDHSVLSDTIHFPLKDMNVSVHSMNDPVVMLQGLDDFGIGVEFLRGNQRREELITDFVEKLSHTDLEYDLEWWYENKLRGIVISETSATSKGVEALYQRKKEWMNDSNES
ncbi:MAG: hypothetical protein AAF587_15625 [Bacteroidota bacterium]